MGEQALGSRGLNSGGYGTWACGPKAESGQEGRRVSGTTPMGGGHPPARERGKGEGGAGGLSRGVWAARWGKKRRGGGKRAARWREGKRPLAGPGCKGGKRGRERERVGQLGWAQKKKREK
jgi:hypothetical protein